MISAARLLKSPLLLLIFPLLVMAGCATPPPLKVTPGVGVDTLNTAVSLTVTGARGQGSARGYLAYRRPDRLHVTLLSPFGTSLLEIYGEGERVVCLIPGQMAAYVGTVADLAQRGVLAEWGLMQWVLAPPPLPGPVPGLSEVANADGTTEKVYFYENGLVQRKVARDGREVVYRDYRAVDGVPFPERVELTGAYGQRVLVVFDEPEVNRPIEEEVLVPRLEGYRVFPLSEFPAKL